LVTFSWSGGRGALGGGGRLGPRGWSAQTKPTNTIKPTHRQPHAPHAPHARTTQTHATTHAHNGTYTTGAHAHQATDGRRGVGRAGQHQRPGRAHTCGRRRGRRRRAALRGAGVGGLGGHVWCCGRVCWLVKGNRLGLRRERRRGDGGARLGWRRHCNGGTYTRAQPQRPATHTHRRVQQVQGNDNE
jgi:hypothetical protein